MKKSKKCESEVAFVIGACAGACAGAAAFLLAMQIKDKKELLAEALSKTAGSSRLEAAFVCVRCSMWSGGAQRSRKIDVG